MDSHIDKKLVLSFCLIQGIDKSIMITGQRSLLSENPKQALDLQLQWKFAFSEKLQTFVGGNES